MRKIMLLALMAIMSIATVFGQSKVAKEFEKKATGYKFFAYQSVLRILNQDKDPDFNKLIRNLDHLRIVTTDSVGVGGLSTFFELDKNIQNEGFEEIMSFDNKDYKCRVFEQSKRSKNSTWLAVFYAQGRAGIIEMVGSLDLKYMSAFSKINMDRVKELAGDTATLDWD
jgi:hypothetical protein